MKKQISPGVFVAILVVVVLLLVVIGFAVLRKPKAAPPIGDAEQMKTIGSPMDMMKKMGGAGFGKKAQMPRGQ